MANFVTDNSFTRRINARTPQGSGHKDLPFRVTFNFISTDEYAELSKNDAALYDRIVQEVHDLKIDGQEASQQELRDLILSNRCLLFPLIRTYYQAITGREPDTGESVEETADVKNSANSAGESPPA